MSMVNATPPQRGQDVADALAGFSSESVLKLFPLALRRSNAQEYTVVRMGCRAITAISTTQRGVEALKLLRRGLSIGEAAAELSRWRNREQVDLTPLLTALRKAEMILAVDGVAVTAERPSLARWLRHSVEWRTMALRRAAVRVVLRCLPVKLAHGCLYLLKPKWPREKRRRERTLALTNLQRLLGPSLPQQRLEKIARAFVAEQVRRDLDMQILMGLPEIEVAQWLAKSTTFYGLERIDEALARGNGVLLCSFHFSSAHLLVLLLWMRGYSFTGAGAITRANYGRLLPFENAELAARIGGCGKVKWHTAVNFDSALAICRALDAGGMALAYPDGFIMRPPGEVARYFGHGAAQYRRAHARVPFFGSEIDANTGVSWIYQQSRAPLLPVKLVRQSGSRFQVLVGPELRLPREGPVSATAAELYRALEREVSLDPAAWAYWRTVDQFSVSAE